MKRTRSAPTLPPLPARITVRVPLTIHRRGGRKRIISPVGLHQPLRTAGPVENAVVKALAKAYRWRTMLESEQYSSITDLANAERVNESYACRLLRLTLLAPTIVEDVLNGTPKAPRMKALFGKFPRDWQAQSSCLTRWES